MNTEIQIKLQRIKENNDIDFETLEELSDNFNPRDEEFLMEENNSLEMTKETSECPFCKKHEYANTYTPIMKHSCHICSK